MKLKPDGLTEPVKDGDEGGSAPRTKVQLGRDRAGGRTLSLPSAGSLRWRTRAPRTCGIWLGLIFPVRKMRAALLLQACVSRAPRCLMNTSCASRPEQ
jgi:hypothetical protein